MNRNILSAVVLSLALPFAAMAQSPSTTAEPSAPVKAETTMKSDAKAGAASTEKAAKSTSSSAKSSAKSAKKSVKKASPRNSKQVRSSSAVKPVVR